MDPGAAVADGVASYLRGAIKEAEQVFARGLGDTDVDSADASILLAWAASARWVQGAHDEARTLAQRSARAANRCADPRAVALSHTVLAMSAASTGDRSETEANLRHALDAAVRAGDVLAQVRLGERTGYVLYRPFVLSHLADAQVLLGRFEEACDCYVAAREAFLAMESPDVAHPLAGLGSTHRARGDVVGARAVFEEAVRQADAGGNLRILLARQAGHAGLDAAAAPRSRVRIDALGTFRVIRDGYAVPATTWQSMKARDLLKILVSRRGRPVTRDELITPGGADDAPVRAR